MGESTAVSGQSADACSDLGKRARKTSEKESQDMWICVYSDIQRPADYPTGMSLLQEGVEDDSHC